MKQNAICWTGLGWLGSLEFMDFLYILHFFWESSKPYHYSQWSFVRGFFWFWEKKITLHAHFHPLDFFHPPPLVYCSYVLVFSKKSHPPRLFQPPQLLESWDSCWQLIKIKPRTRPYLYFDGPKRLGFRKETKMMLNTTGLVYKWLWLRSAGVDLPHICFNEQSVNVNCIKEEVWLQWHLLELFLRVGSTLYILWYLYFFAEPVSAKARAKRRKV